MSSQAKAGITGWRAQFAHPRGWLGAWVGRLMAVKNRERSAFVLSLLELGPRDRVLEIGFGPGADVRRAAEAAGFVAGVDHSAVMVAQARRRNAAAEAAGRVRLERAPADDLPFADGCFDKAYAINVAQFWPGGAWSEIRRVLRADGLAAVAVQPRSKGATEETARRVGEELTEALRSAGFRDVRLERKAMKPVSVVCALGRR